MFAEGCKYLKYDKTPSWGWFKRFWLKNKNYINPERQGKTKYNQENGIYAKIIPAKNAGTQFQMDGWELPFWCRKPGNNGKEDIFFKYVLFVVMDAHSRKIVGFDVAESENTTSILTALEMAVKENGILPRELVADNHSWNRTKEAANLRAATEEMGMKWTVDSNPRRKGIVERSFGILGKKHFKKCYGYLGQGVKSKTPNGITQQELRDKYAKIDNMLLYSQLLATVCVVIQEYNNKARNVLEGKSPNEAYAISEQPHSIPVDDSTRLRLFIPESEHKISNGQITITRGMHGYEYQLPAKISNDYNGKTVRVRRSNFERIYLYDLDTGSFICDVPVKSEICGAFADQTETDIENLNKQSGRKRGINRKRENKKESIFTAGNITDPSVIEYLNVLSTPKDILKQANQNADIRAYFQEKGINPNSIPDMPDSKSLYADNRLKDRDEKHIFHKKNSDPIEKIEIEI